MKECICIKTHNKTDDYIKSNFKKSNIYNYSDNLFNALSSKYIFVVADSYKNRNMILIEKVYQYNRVQFEEYFTTDISVIRKLKLDKIKKVVQK